MSQVYVKWLEKLQFVGIDSTKHSIVISATDEENGTGVKPSDLLLLSLAGCTAYDVVNILRKKRQQLTGLEIAVEGEQEPDPPWTFTRIHVTFHLTGRSLSEKAAKDAVELATEKYCSVYATLKAGVEITYEHVIEEAQA